MSGKVYGYIRPAAGGVSMAEQKGAVMACGVEAERIVVDGQPRGRTGYRKLCERLEPGDTLLVKSLNQLGGSYEEILEQWRFLTKVKQVSVAVLDMPLVDTRRTKSLSGEDIADMALQFLTFAAKNESDSVNHAHERQAVGIAMAKAKGVQFGRPERERPPHFQAVYGEWAAGHLSGRAAAEKLGVAPRTFKKWAMETESSV